VQNITLPVHELERRFSWFVTLAGNYFEKSGRKRVSCRLSDLSVYTTISGMVILPENCL
jgi:hypothetical protein